VGYAEFGGTGSVRWEVQYRKTKGSTLHKNLLPFHKLLSAHGVDAGARTSRGDKLYVICTDARVVGTGEGTVTVEVSLADKKDQVALRWGTDVPTRGTDTPRAVPRTRATRRKR
jgi:hypothetical protein